MPKGYKIFENQLADTCLELPNLRIKTKNEQKYLQGIIDIKNSEQETIQSFFIEIYYAKGFPYRFPKLLEVGGSIPCNPDWHKYSDNSCCITVDPDEILQCKHGINIIEFIRKQVIPYLANQCYKKITGKYKDEYPHGNKGIFVFYTALMKTSDQEKWIQYIKYAFGIEKLKIGRNDLCICGSRCKFKKCHQLVFDALRQIGKDNILKHLKVIIS